MSAAKRAAARGAVAMVEDGMVVGLGSGTTAREMVRELGERVSREGLRVVGVPTSEATLRQARELGIQVRDDYPDHLGSDLVLDGADEVSPQGHLVKGGGGALLREKLVARAGRRLVIMVDPTKHVSHLGPGFPIPIEVVPFGWKDTLERLQAAGADPRLRLAGEEPYLTDGGHFIVDCAFAPIDDPLAMEMRLKGTLGVVEVGLFVGLADAVVTGHDDGSWDTRTFA